MSHTFGKQCEEHDTVESATCLEGCGDHGVTRVPCGPWCPGWSTLGRFVDGEGGGDHG